MRQLLTAVLAASLLFAMVIAFGIAADGRMSLSQDAMQVRGSVTMLEDSQEIPLTERVTELENQVANLTGRLQEVEQALGLSLDSGPLPDDGGETEIDEETPTALRNANIRGGPGTDFDVVRSIWGGTELIIVGYNDDSGRIWYKLDNGGWIAGSLVANEPSDVPYVAAVTTTQADDWVLYTNVELGFSAYIPAEYVPVEHEPEPENPARAVTFSTEGDDFGPDSAVITVLAIPMLDVGGQQLSLAELRRGASEMAENNNVTIIDGPTPFVFDGATAVSVKTEASFVGQDTTVRGFTVLVSTSHRFFYIEVAGLASYEGLLNNIFNDFMSGFRILE